MVSQSASISACEKGEQWEAALGLLQEMVRRSLTPNVVSCSAAISACEKDEHWEAALGLLQEMARRSLTPNSCLQILQAKNTFFETDRNR